MMADWHAYVILEVTGAALTGAQKTKLVTALKRLGRQTDNQPALITHMRPRPDGMAALLEITLTAEMTKAEALDALAAELGISRTTLNSRLNFTVLTGKDWSDRAQAARDYIAANAAAWGEDQA